MSDRAHTLGFLAQDIQLNQTPVPFLRRRPKVSRAPQSHPTSSPYPIMAQLTEAGTQLSCHCPGPSHHMHTSSCIHTFTHLHNLCARSRQGACVHTCRVQRHIHKHRALVHTCTLTCPRLHKHACPAKPPTEGFPTVARPLTPTPSPALAGPCAHPFQGPTPGQ
jgi:hypothetical protein